MYEEDSRLSYADTKSASDSRFERMAHIKQSSRKNVMVERDDGCSNLSGGDEWSHCGAESFTDDSADLRYANEREIWGTNIAHYGYKQLPFGTSTTSPWRAGANENTTIMFSDDATVEGKSIPAGTYGLFMGLSEDGKVEVIFSTNIYNSRYSLLLFNLRYYTFSCFSLSIQKIFFENVFIFAGEKKFC